MQRAEIEARLDEINQRIERAAEKSGRSAADIMVVAVTKTHPAELIQTAYDAGLRHFGENRVEEFSEKIDQTHRQAMPDAVWHMIGHIQSRKTADVAPAFEWVHSVERLKIARRLADERGPSGKDLSILLQVNISGEDSKFGYPLANWPDDRSGEAGFFADIEQISTLSGVEVRGLMTLAPYSEEPESVRYVFRNLRLLRDDLAERYPTIDWGHLSAGMSGDFEVAIEEGATIVRLGTVLFGPRDYT